MHSTNQRCFAQNQSRIDVARSSPRKCAEWFADPFGLITDSKVLKQIVSEQIGRKMFKPVRCSVSHSLFASTKQGSACRDAHQGGNSTLIFRLVVSTVPTVDGRQYFTRDFPND